MKSALLTKCVPVLLALAALHGFGTTGAKALGIYTFVSSSGDDANSCITAATACRSFVAAHNKTAEGGTIICANPEWYQVLAITKPITVDCLAGGGGFNTQQITISAPGKTVRLQNLGVNALGSDFAIAISAAATVQLSNVRVAGVNGPAILDQRTGPG